MLAAALALALSCCLFAPAALAQCFHPDGTTTVTVGKQTTVCLVLNSLVWGESRTYDRVVITPAADDFSRINVPGSYLGPDDAANDPLVTTHGDEIAFHIESAGGVSFQKLYRNTTSAQTFSIFTAIIQVNKGEVVGITWDDGCHFCNSGNCAANSYLFDGTLQSDARTDCYWTDTQCLDTGVVSSSASDLCQLQVYVVWSGTDANGVSFQSPQKRLSLFAGPAVADYIEDIRVGASETAASAAETVSDAADGAADLI